ncbi:hypothetical protein [Bosea sp. (in: a-proteobacteria)]|uniref:hypothetical protein n=1 Tax=Bosea sp. (in: a-proteobacteria) TaxID=1871050 RepID=UPI001AC0386C|nr:hypothetical protein [Bosea sp. (in: a-proteobacteria)]MBN9443659.1 hypothetical protein [Bosea sp. (in: a-proteobacteria)]
MTTMSLAASFKIFLKCENCRRPSSVRLDVPDVDDAPCDVDELVDSAFLQRQVFTCEICESAIGTIIGINRVE